jgi:hypothetical protein
MKNEKLSLAMKGKHNSPGTEFKKGCTSVRKGKHLLQSTKDLLSLSHKGQHPSTEFKKGQKMPWTAERKKRMVGKIRKKNFPFTKEELYKLYWEDNLGQNAIAQIKGISRKVVRYWMEKWQIPRRPEGNYKGSKCSAWKGGRLIEKSGYVKVWVSSDSPFFPMAKKTSPTTGHILEHRLVMAEYLGRCLLHSEIVHHKGIRYGDDIRNKSDNLIDNLELTVKGKHSKDHSKGYQDGYRQGYQDGQGTQLKELRDEIKLLQWQIKQLTESKRYGSI